MEILSPTSHIIYGKVNPKIRSTQVHHQATSKRKARFTSCGNCFEVRSRRNGLDSAESNQQNIGKIDENEEIKGLMVDFYLVSWFIIRLNMVKWVFLHGYNYS
jgi:hypothetical protein